FASFLLVTFFYFFLTGGQGSILLIGVTITLLSLISSLYQPTVRASIPSLVDRTKLAKANGLAGGVAALSNLAGPVAGGILYNFIGLEALVLTGAIAFLLSAVMEMFIHLTCSKEVQNESMLSLILSDMRAGL